MVASVFSASASCAFADSSWPCRSMRRASRSAVSTRTSTCPACTASPSRTVIWRTSPDTFALTVAWRTGCIVPDTGSQRLSGVASTAARSAGANSSVTGAPLSASRPSCAFFATRIATEPAMPPTTSNTTRATITRRRVNAHSHDFSLATPARTIGPGERLLRPRRPCLDATGMAFGFRRGRFAPTGNRGIVAAVRTFGQPGCDEARAGRDELLSPRRRPAAAPIDTPLAARNNSLFPGDVSNGASPHCPHCSPRRGNP